MALIKLIWRETLKSDLSGTFFRTNRVGAIKSSQILKMLVWKPLTLMKKVEYI
jgi:hypothetical protein